MTLETQFENFPSFSDEDFLKRKEIAERLSEHLSTLPNSVLAIDSVWGSGKTTFLKKWSSLLLTQNQKVVYFNAWENDHFADPIIPIVGELSDYLDLNSADKDQTLKLIKTTFYEIIRMLMKGADIQNIEDSMKNGTDFAYSDFKVSYQQKKDIRIALSQLVTTNNNLYFFIDELDRCKPLFAINLLERIKHFFDIEGIHFIVAVDLHQLGKSIQAVYGDIDSNSYFKKFFDYEVHLPSPDVVNYFKMLTSTIDLNIPTAHRVLDNMCQQIKMSTSFTLRHADRLYSTLKFILPSMKGRPVQLELISAMLMIKIIDPSQYKSILMRTANLNSNTLGFSFGLAFGYPIQPNGTTEFSKFISIYSNPTYETRMQASKSNNITISMTNAEYGVVELAEKYIELKS